MARAFSAFANGGYRIDGALFGNRPRAIASRRARRRRSTRERRSSPKRVLTPTQAAIVDEILQGVVRAGTGTRARRSRAATVAGKTGTTEDYGDAWFVGYTPQLVVAVWVGYPNELRPMLTEYDGDAGRRRHVPGADLEARSCDEGAARSAAEPMPFPRPTSAYVGTEARSCSATAGSSATTASAAAHASSSFYGDGRDPGRRDCKANEVDVPRVVGTPLARARERLAAQPLTPEVVYKPARPRQRPSVVLGRSRAGGTLSSHDTVTLVLAKPLHGVVPRVVGLTLAQARREARARGTCRSRSPATPTAGRRRRPAARCGGVAAAPRHDGHAGRSGRLRKREPASP